MATGKSSTPSWKIYGWCRLSSGSLTIGPALPSRCPTLSDDPLSCEFTTILSFALNPLESHLLTEVNVMTQ